MRHCACLLLCAVAGVAPAAEPVARRTFDVAALVVPIPDFAMPPLGKVTAPPPVVAASRAARSADLLRALDAVAPDAAGWATFGDTGQMLTVAHSPAVIEQVAARLAELTAKAERCVSVECRVLTLPAGAADGCGLPAADQPAVLTADQLARVLAAAQANRRLTILQSPKLTVFDGHRAGVWVGDEQSFVTAVEATRTGGSEPVMIPKSDTYRTGTAFEVRPTVAADRRAIALEVGFQQAEIDGVVPLFPVTQFVTLPGEGKPVPFTQFIQQPKLTRREVRQTAAVPDGQTLVLHAGRRTAYVDAGAGPLADVPYLNRLVRSKMPVSEEVVVLLTARVVAADAR